MPDELDFRVDIPLDLLKLYKDKPRLVGKFPWVIGFPAPDAVIDKEFLQKLKASGFQVVLVPSARMQEH